MFFLENTFMIVSLAFSLILGYKGFSQIDFKIINDDKYQLWLLNLRSSLKKWYPEQTKKILLLRVLMIVLALLSSMCLGVWMASSFFSNTMKGQLIVKLSIVLFFLLLVGFWKVSDSHNQLLKQTTDLYVDKIFDSNISIASNFNILFQSLLGRQKVLLSGIVMIGLAMFLGYMILA